ncbi:hypothetical protein GCM10008943_15880 [Paenochrobactrum glaciei]|uniref:Uncharacterized protein n=1 Tax=Paenochrobactrum glaciei TaxID=486407 RepID=A0ABN1G058_9HYPH
MPEIRIDTRTACTLLRRTLKFRSARATRERGHHCHCRKAKGETGRLPKVHSHIRLIQIFMNPLMHVSAQAELSLQQTTINSTAMSG